MPICKRCNLDVFLGGYLNCLECRQAMHPKCSHDKRIGRCRICSPSEFCLSHGKRKDSCKRCCPDPIKKTIQNMIGSTKMSDKKYNRFNEILHVDYDYLYRLIELSQDKCQYCNIPVQYIEYSGNLGTIERYNNHFGHIKGNCCIACRTCNFRGH